MLGRFPSLFEIVFVVGKHLHGILPILKKMMKSGGIKNLTKDIQFFKKILLRV